MTSMGFPTTSEVLDVTEHLPDGATLVVHQVSWEDYELLLDELAERPHLRVTYDCGTLEIVSPLPEHEQYARFIDSVVLETCDASNMEVEPLGGSTWKRRVLGKGLEGDCCYYVKNAWAVIGKRKIDLETDPPPDIAVEIDITSNSLKKLSIYAALSIQEVWRYDGRDVQIYRLKNGKYVETAGSQMLPRLTGAIISEFIELMKTQGSTKARHAFRRRIRAYLRA
jgi:Uma2 family endonuclease